MRLIANLLILCGLGLAVHTAAVGSPVAQMRGPCKRPKIVPDPNAAPPAVICLQQNRWGCTPFFAECDNGPFKVINWGQSGCQNENEIGCANFLASADWLIAQACDCQLLGLTCVPDGTVTRGSIRVVDCQLEAGNVQN